MADLAARVMAVQHRRPGFSRKPLVAPADHDHEQVKELGALVGQDVLEPRSTVVGPTLAHAALDEVVQPFGEDLARNAEVGLKLLEPGDTGPHVTQNQRRPGLADDIKGAGDRARHLAEVCALHDHQASSWGSLTEL